MELTGSARLSTSQVSRERTSIPSFRLHSKNRRLMKAGAEFAAFERPSGFGQLADPLSGLSSNRERKTEMPSKSCHSPNLVIPAKAGIHRPWVPAFARTTSYLFSMASQSY